MVSIAKSDGTAFKLPEDQKEKVEKSIAVIPEVFHAKATDGKIVNAQAMEVYFDLMKKYEEIGIVTEDDVEDMKLFENDFQGAVDICDANNDGFIDFGEFKNLIKEAESTYTKSLFKAYDLNMDGYITQDEMDTVVSGIEKPNRAKRVREIFDLMLQNFDADGDGRISWAEFTESMKSLDW